jgi:addiction module HigA family antidote
MTQRPLDQFNPDYATAPGEILAETLEARGIAKADFAQRCGLSPKVMGLILTGKAHVQPEMAAQFERVLGVAASVWINLETAYRDAEHNPKPSNPSKKPLIRGAILD